MRVGAVASTRHSRRSPAAAAARGRAGDDRAGRADRAKLERAPLAPRPPPGHDPAGSEWRWRTVDRDAVRRLRRTRRDRRQPPPAPGLRRSPGLLIAPAAGRVCMVWRTDDE